MLDQLTDKQLARMAEFRDKWIEIGLCTEPANRPQAEKAIRQMYRAGGLKPPQRIVWCGSPLSQGLTRAIVLDENFRCAAAQKLRTLPAGASVGDSVRASVWNSVGASVGDSVRDSVYGSHDAGWLAFYEYFERVCALKEQTKKLRGLWLLARSAGWALPHQNICWVSERHHMLLRDDRGRLHSVTGPAVAYPDGWSIYAVRGVRVPADWIEQREALDVKTALTWQNVEQRRAAAEILGWARILAELPTRTLDADPDPQIGTLVAADLPDAPDSRFLRVTCGTGRVFVLGVPRECRTALEANARTYRLKPEEYQLEART